MLYDDVRTYFRTLTVKDIDHLIQDLEFERAGGQLYYAVDPHDLVDFSFPISSNGQIEDIDNVAADQAALYEVFYVWRDKCLLLPEYVEELKRLITYFERQTEEVYATTDVVQNMIKEGGLGDVNSKRSGEFEELVTKHFNVIIAVAMGLYSLGTERFMEVVRPLLQRSPFSQSLEKDLRVLNGIWSDYRRSKLSDKIFLQVRGYIHALSPADRERKERALRLDAAALDRIAYLNNALDEAFQSGTLTKRYSIRYLSSAKRTRNIFDTALEDATWWRTRRHIFAYVVATGLSGSPQASPLAVEHLKMLRDSIEKLDQVESYLRSKGECEHCILKSGQTDSCELLSFCRTVTEVRSQMISVRSEIDNLALFNRIGMYQKLLRTHSLGKRGSKVTTQWLLDLFAKASDSGVKDAAVEWMRLRQQWMEFATDSTDNLRRASNETWTREESSLRLTNDGIVGIDQVFPICPNIRTSNVRIFFRSIQQYIERPEAATANSAYAQYFKLDTLSNQLGNPEYELAECYMHLVFGGVDGAIKASRLLGQRVATEDRMTALREQSYVVCWALRRCGEFNKADTVASEALERWPDDARFYHGRALTDFSWITRGADYPFSVDRLVSDTRKAIELYRRPFFQFRPPLVAISYSNLAFFLCLKCERDKSLTPDETVAIVKDARTALRELKRMTLKRSEPKQTKWSPKHPEYYHSEAFVEYWEALTADSTDEARRKLECALAEIEAASQIYNHPDYYTLKMNIQRALKSMRA